MNSRWSFILLVTICSITLGSLFFHGSDKALFSSDAPAYIIQNHQHVINSGYKNLWSWEYGLGQPYGPIATDQTAVIYSLVPFPFTLTALFVTSLLIEGVGMFILLKSLKLNSFASIFGAMALVLSNGIITLVFPGHVNKIFTYAWVPFSIAFFLKGLESHQLKYFSVSGCFFGLAVLGGEMQMAFYLGLWFVAWAGYYLLTSSAKIKKSIFLGLLSMLGFSVLVSFQKIVHALYLITSLPPIVGAENSDQNWKFVTQYFFPPEEMLSYITTGQFFGGAEAYWGRDGYPTPLRLSDDYMGLIPLGFALVAIVVCWKIWQARLFILMGVTSLFISFGKEGFLFWLLYQLPTMKSQRSPHRWSYFVSLSVTVLAAYGVHWLINKLQETSTNRKNLEVSASPKWGLWNRSLIILGLSGVLLYFFSILFQNQPQSLVPLIKFFVGLTQGNISPNEALLLQQSKLMIASLFRTGYFLAFSAASVWLLILFGQKKEWRNPWWKFHILSGFVLFITILDLSFNAKRFIQFYPWKDFYEKNELIQFLKKDTDAYRIKVLGTQQNQLLNQLVTSVLPYHHLSVVDPPAVSRMLVDYKDLFDYMATHYVPSNHYFDLFNIKYVLSPAPFNDPNMKVDFIGQWNGIHVYKRVNFMPRAWLAPQIKVVKENKDAMIFATIHPGRNFYESVILEENPLATYPELKEYSKMPMGNISPPQDRFAKITQLEENHLRIETQAAVPTFLVLSEKWDSHWKAWVDDVPAKIYKANFLMRAVELPAGNHIVRMEYRPPSHTFWISLTSVAGFALFGLVLFLKRCGLLYRR